MKIMMFLGSGISFASNLPCVSIITNRLLNEEWHDYTEEVYLRGKLHDPKFDSKNIVQDFNRELRNIAPRLQAFLNILKEYSDDYLKGRGYAESTYEDLYYLAQQIADDQEREIDNPAIKPFIDDLKIKTKHLCIPIPLKEDMVTLNYLASRSCYLIQSVVQSSLYTREEPKGLELITELVKNTQIEQLDIATLNHDLLIEKVLTKSNSKIIDGFGLQDGQARYFDMKLFDNYDTKVSLFKLHGSINWYRFRINDNQGQNIFKYGVTSADPSFCKNAKGKLLFNLENRPMFLTGSYNKMFNYGFGIFAQVHHKFYERLFQHDKIIVSGYGWNDIGINGRLFQWFFSSPEKRFILLHRNPEDEIKRKSKSAMRYRYDDLVNDGRLIPIRKWLSEIKMNEVFKYLK